MVCLHIYASRSGKNAQKRGNTGIIRVTGGLCGDLLRILRRADRARSHLPPRRSGEPAREHKAARGIANDRYRPSHFRALGAIVVHGLLRTSAKDTGGVNFT